MDLGKHQYYFSNGHSCALFQTDKDLQLLTKTEQDRLQDIDKNISYNNHTISEMNLCESQQCFLGGVTMISRTDSDLQLLTETN